MALIHESSKVLKFIDSNTPMDLDLGSTSNANDSDVKDKNENMRVRKESIKKCRTYSKYPKSDSALTDISNEAVVSSEKNSVIVEIDKEINNDSSLTPSEIKLLMDEIPKSFSRIKKVLKFNNFGTQIFRNWYIDGGLYVYVHREKNTKTENMSIKEIRFLDPLKLKYDSVKKEYNYSNKETDTGNTTNSYMWWSTNDKEEQVDIPQKDVFFIPSGLVDENGMTISYMLKAVRPLNLLLMMENSLIIQRFVRAPERWVFKIDVSGMNKKRAKAYMENMITKYKSRFTINALSGDINANNMVMSMQENIWLPKTNSNNGGHEVDTVGGGQNLGDIDDILYWNSKVDESLNIPSSGEGETMFSFSSKIEEITAKQYKFFRFIKYLRIHFNVLFIKLIQEDLIVGKVIDKDTDWNEIEDYINFIYKNDSAYEEAKEMHKLEARLEFINTYEALLIKYYGIKFIRKRILKQTDEEIKEVEAEQKKMKVLVKSNEPERKTINKQENEYTNTFGE